VDHAVAVGAEQGKIADVPGAFPANVQRLDVVAFDVALAAFPVGIRHRMHNLWFEQEALDDLLGAPPAVGRLAQITRAVNLA